MRDSILIAAVGKTDPIRGEHDGPILHIVRHYRPEAVILILSKEIGKDEEEYHHNETAIHLLDRDCKVEAIPTEIHDAHSYDDFSTAFLAICSETRKRYPDKKVDRKSVV